MKIAICGSMQFAKEMIDIQNKLNKLGHLVIVPKDTEKYVIGEKNLENKWAKIEGDLIRGYYNKIKDCDAILVINITKSNVLNYIGGNAFLEIAFAHILDKKIFLLNNVPEMNYKDEIEAMQPIILNGDLSKII